ncbi:uncharacterized protein LOC130510795 [Raphanus sativus]|uniref:Uncharacterized protein LOC130510795 n=1 Tax=Raphanus sativus TaxID=3726 RepID=A0A9W3DHQ0_RAPSA|nr:uncharacterized protein LOC130510795 [Raphanus sativus]
MLWINIYYSCDVTKCPIEPGPFVLTLDNINDPDGNHLSGEYILQFLIDNGDSPIEGFCASFSFHANALPEFMNIPTTNSVSVRKVEIFPFKVTVNDNPVFRITVNTPKNISSSSTVSARMTFEGGSELIPKSSRFGYRLCDSTKNCPIVPGTFELAIPHPYWRYKMEAGKYRVEVQIVNQNIPFDVSMSVVFWFQVSEA